MAYVGCISGAILIEDYERQLIEAGFSNVQVIDSGADLNAYAKIENQAGCCSPVEAKEEKPKARAASGCCGPVKAEAEAAASCCAPASIEGEDKRLFEQFTDLLARYNVNDYAASVKVYAVK